MTKNSGVWIGPTKCDEERLLREKDLEKIWNIVKPMLEGNNFIPSVYGTVSVSLDLLREALNCYQNGAYLAACGASRASVEALLYLATTRKPISDYETVEIKENYLRERRKQFLKDATTSKLIDEEEEMIVQDIWKAGDFAMHIHQKLDQNAERFKMRASQNVTSDIESLKGWSNKEEALNTITSTATLASKVIYRLNAHLQSSKSEGKVR